MAAKKKWVSSRVITYVTIRSVYDSRLIVPPDKTPSGSKYVFQPGQALPVLAQDKQALLSLKTPGGGCCGGSQIDPQYYFKEV